MKTIKITFLVICTLCISITTVAQNGGATLDFKNYDANIALVESYISAMNAGDAKKMNSLFTDDAMIVGLGGTSDTLTKQQHLERYQASFKTDEFKVMETVNLSVKVEDKANVPAGEYAFSWGKVMSTNKATKKSASATYHVVVAIDNGKIAYFAHYYDSMPFAMRDGAKLMMPEK